ncbi:MAG: hypothetical protein GY844_29655 [Bradyrhizobium sp.]|nr:hypothetical protein [Bradyrhizobium sp.]
MPDGFALIAGSMTRNELRRHYNRSMSTIDNWLRLTGITPRKPGKRGQPGVVPLNLPPRDTGRAALAAEYLRRFGPVSRCDEAGSYAPHGAHWRRGRSILTADQIIAAATERGWQPEAWRRLAA